MKKASFVLAVLLCLLLAGGAVLPAGANSAMKTWRGVNGEALRAADGCPVEVLGETLTVDIGAFPDAQGAPGNDASAGDASVTAEYTLKNPTDGAVSVRLFFPVGQTPYYGYESGKYGVFVNDSPVKIVRRFSAPRNASFDTDDELEKLQDGLAAFPLLSPEQQVTAVSFRLGGFTGEAEVTLSHAGTARAVLCKFSYALVSTTAGGLRLDARPGDTCRLVLFGAADSAFSWTFKDAETGAPLPEAKAEETARETLTFREFAAVGAESSPIGETDRYNAVAADFSTLLQDMAPGELSYTDQAYFADDENYMEWYEYTLDFAPGQTLVNKVTAPFFPDLDTDWLPYKYTYTYLLSPAKSWAAFGGLDIEVHTSAYLLKSSLQGFHKTDTGWALHTDGLPDKELTFTLCATELPKRDPATVKSTVLIFAYLGGTILLSTAVIFGMIYGIFKLFKKRKNK